MNFIHRLYIHVLCQLVSWAGAIVDLGIPKGPGTSISWTLKKDYAPFYELINTPQADTAQAQRPPVYARVGSPLLEWEMMEPWPCGVESLI